MKLDDRCPALGDLEVGRVAQHSFVPLGLLGGLGNFTRSGDFLLHAFDYANGHGLAHVTHRKTTCRVERKMGHCLRSCRESIASLLISTNPLI